jgi:3-oxoacyl-[acyl-carrier protein] reductase
MTNELEGNQLASIRRRSPFNRFPSVDEVANVVDFLMSQASSGVHGANFTVDLGSTA